MNGSEILTEAHELINGPRQQAYSHPFDDYYRVKELFYSMTGIELTVQHAITFMVCVKLGRMAHNMQQGDWHRDSIVDAAGYLGCLSIAHEYSKDRITEITKRLRADQ